MSNNETPLGVELPRIPANPLFGRGWMLSQVNAIQAYGLACAKAVADDRDALRSALSQCAVVVGASASTDCSVEFLACVPREVELVVGKLRTERDTLKQRVEELEASVSHLMAQRAGHVEAIEWRDSEIGNLRRQLEAKGADGEQLRTFAQKVMAFWPDGGIDGFDLQDIAGECGMLCSVQATEPCGRDCNCASECGEWPVECFRRTPLLLGDGPVPAAEDIAGLRADAERYRWLRDSCDTTTGFLLCQRVESDQWGATIDAARSAQAAAGEGDGSRGGG